MRKLILILLLSFSVLTDGYAQDSSREKLFILNDFSKLHMSQVSPHLVPPNGAVEARNVRANTLYGSLNKRADMKLYGSMGSFRVTGLHRYYLTDATKHLIASGSTVLTYGDDDDGTFTTIRDELTDGYKFDCLTYNDTEICTNGQDNVQKWDGKTQTTANTDGSRSANILTADLGAPYAELNTGSNLDASSWYQYKVAFYDGSVYYYSTTKSNPILTGSTVRDITLTDIPLGPDGTTHRYIYRTEGNASRTNVEADTSYYLAITIANNTATTANDTMDDATLTGDAAPTWSTVSAGTDLSPPIAKFLTIHKERLFLANSPSFKSYFYWSFPFKPDIFNPINYEPILPDDGDEITFIENQLGVLVLGKTNSISKYLTYNSDSTKWYIEGPFSYIGCVAPYSAQNTPIGIIYLSRKGIYVFNGESSQLISDIVTKDINDIDLTSPEDVASVFSGTLYQIAYTSKEKGTGTNDTVLILDITRDAFVIDDKSLYTFTVFNSGDDFGTVYSGSSEADGKVYAHSSSPDFLNIRYKSDLDAGTKDSIAISGTENAPSMEIGWGVTIDSTDLAGHTIDAAVYSSATIDRPGTSGTWWSDNYNIGANSLSKLYWNETLGSFGDVTFAFKSAATEATLSGATWSSEYSVPSGSDISGETANNWIQLRASLSTTDIDFSPTLGSVDNYVIRLGYNKEGDSAETTINSIYKTGWMNFNAPFANKWIKSVEVHYAGDSGTVNINFRNLVGDSDYDMQIDLSVNPSDDNNDEYYGNADNKAYLWLSPIDSSSSNYMIGKNFQLTISETGVGVWKIFKIIIHYYIQEYYPSV